MTMKLNGQTKNDYEQAKAKFMNAVKNNASQEEQGILYGEMLDKLQDHMISEARQGVNNDYSATRNPHLSGEEITFFNELDKELPVGIEKLLPEQTIDRIFEDIKKEHPLLEKIGLQNAGLRLKFISSENTGSATWGKIFGEIKGQLKASFGSRQEIQNKLTAFVVIPKDFKDYGAEWIENYIRTQLTEAFALALEEAFLNGDGDNKPIGLTKKITGKAQDGVTTYPKKEKQTGKITFESPRATINQVADIFKFHSEKENGEKYSDVTNKVVLVVNSSEIWEIEKALTNLSDNADYKKAVPLGLQIIPSVAQEKGFATSFVQGRYDAFVGGGIDIQRYQETLAVEDMDLFIAKQFAYGKAHDEKVSAIWELDFSKINGQGIGG